MIGYKVVRENYTDCYSGTVRYTVDESATVDADPNPLHDCGAGLHAAYTPEAAIGYRRNLWPVRLLRVEGEPIYKGDDKMRCAALTVLEERPVAECFGPCGEGVVNLLNSLSSYRWFAPQGDPREEIQALVVEHLWRLAPYGATVVPVRFVGDWSAARSAAVSAAWSAAVSAARSAAWSAAVSAAESAAWSAAVSAAVSAAWSAVWQTVGDLMPGADPWQPLLEIFRLGGWPVGQVKNEFVVFVPGVGE